jgi:putative membrane protein
MDGVAVEISSSNTRKAFPLSEKKIIKKTLTGTLALVIILLVIYVVTFVTMKSNDASNWLSLVTAVVGALLLLLIGTTYKYQQWYFAVYYYEFAADYVVIRKGPITPHEITIPYERIQDVYVDQDLFDRFFGLYDVHLSSATVSSGLEAHIDGVDKEGMEGLRAALLETVKKRISKSGKG